MLRKMIVICVSVALCLVWMTGCAKKQPTTKAPTGPKTTAPAPAEEQPKTEAEYKAEADKQITQQNAAQELDQLEKSVNEDAAKEQAQP